MNSAVTAQTTQISLRVPTEILAQVDELATLMQRSRSFVLTEALRSFIATELEDAQIVAQEVADIEAHPEVGVPHEEALDWLIAQGSLTRDAVETARRRRVS